jgi:hypothetical protein
MLILSGILAFHVLDRLTGSWTVMDSEWMQDFADPMIKKKPVRLELCLRKPRGCLLHDRRSQLVWLFINIIFWLAVGYACVKVLSVMTFATQGVSTIRIRIMQKLIMVRHCRCGR